MKKLLVLCGILSLLGCTAAPHTIQLEQSSIATVELICVNNLEYIIQSRGGILLIMDKNNKPKQCNY